MQFDRQPEAPRGREHPRDLLAREGDRLAEAVDRVDEPLRRERRQHGLGPRRDSRRGRREFGRKRVRAEKGRARPRPGALRQAARGAQHLALGRAVEAVAGFDLDRRDALGDERVKSRQRLADEVVLARLPGRADGRDDAAPGARDLLVGRAPQARLELGRAVAGVDEMGVAIDRARA